MSTKHCRTCEQVKPLADFWKGQSACISCSKIKQKTWWASHSPKKRLEQHLKYKYGVTHDEFRAAWDAQQGACAICCTELPDLMTYDNRRRGYAIDHNHESGAFRGILCLKCNSLLGMASESIDVLKAAMKYLNERGSYASAARKKGK